jgi:hypothetical protein
MVDPTNGRITKPRLESFGILSQIMQQTSHLSLFAETKRFTESAG